jgi:hypothetical protein
MKPIFSKLTGVFALGILCAAAAPLQATQWDLTLANFSGTASDTFTGSAGSVQFTQMHNVMSTGDNTFVQVGFSSGIGKAYNTTVDGVLNNGSSDTFNHALALSGVPTLLLGGVTYREFNLNINQTALNPRITLDDVQVFLTSTGNQSVTAFVTPGPSGNRKLDLASSSLIYRMDEDGDPSKNETILLDYSLNPNPGGTYTAGSGTGDMRMLVPDSWFTAALASHPTYTSVVLYSKFGDDKWSVTNTNFGSNGDFDEWFVCNGSSCTAQVPEPASLILFGMGLVLGAGQLSKRWKRKD